MQLLLQLVQQSLFVFREGHDDLLQVRATGRLSLVNDFTRPNEFPGQTSCRRLTIVRIVRQWAAKSSIKINSYY